MSKLRQYLTESKVAKTILQQIKELDKWAMASWGAKQIVTMKDGVQFDVKGSKHRGRVIIKLDKMSDTYILQLGTIRNLDWKVKKELRNIFAGDLVNILDNHIG